MTVESTIDYEGLAQEAMRGVVRKVLARTAKSGLAGDHHFYISFDTEAPGVSLSRRLKEKYPHEMTIEQIARLIIEMTGSKSQVVYKPLPEDDPKVRQPDITRARTLLGWEPKVDLREGLSHTIEYFRQKVTS